METAGFTLDELKKQDPEKYFQEILEVDEFKELKIFVEDSNEGVGWIDLVREGVVKIEGKKVEGIYLPGNLDLRWSEIKTLWKLKKVGGKLDCSGVETLESLGELEYLGKHGFFTGTKIRSLGNLKEIGGSLDCEGTKTLEDLGDLEKVMGQVILSGTGIKSLGNLKKVLGYLNCKGLETLEDLGNLEAVLADFLDLRGTKIKSLGKLKKMGGHLHCEGVETLEDLGNLEEVLGSVLLKGTKIKSFGKLKEVGCNLYGEGIEKLEDIGELEYVGGNIDIEGLSIEIKKFFLKKIREGKLKVGGEIIPYGDMNQMYEGGNLNYEKFKEKYGDNINEIEYEEIKEIARCILTIEYEIIVENLKEKGKKIQKENEGKKLTEEKKKEIRKKAMKLGKELGEIKEKIEEFGVKLENL